MVDEIRDENRALQQKLDAIAERIIRLMEVRELNQQQLADAMGKHESYISRVLGGGVNVTMRTVVEFEEALGAEILSIPSTDDDARGEHRSGGSSTGDRPLQLGGVSGTKPVPSDSFRMPERVVRQLYVRSREEGVLPETLATSYIVRGLVQDGCSD